jgi:hypothetical protein
LDHLGYNQQVSRQLNPVGDILLTCRIAFPDDTGRVAFRVHDGCDWFRAEWAVSTKSACLFRGDRLLTTARLPAVAYARGVTVRLATCDRQLLMDVEGLTVFRWPYERSREARAFVTRPLGIAATGTALRVDRLQVWRDLYYLDPRGLARPWSLEERLAEKRFLVLGDNPAVSRDSRHRSPPGVPQGKLLGRVLRIP